MELIGAGVLVIGMARSGLAAVRLLAAQGARVTACDQKRPEEIPDAAADLAQLGVALIPQTPDVGLNRDLVVVSPGVPADAEPLANARRAGVPVIGELELASYFLKGRTIAITGSNGKTTTTALVGHILRACGIPAQVGGNIGTAPASMVDSSRPGQWNVLEVSSFQLETISHFRADIGVALNLSPDHLDRHGSMETYAAAKSRLFRTQRQQDWAVLNADDPICLSYASISRGRPVWFSLQRVVTPGVWLNRGTILFDDQTVMQASEIPLRGLHNVENVLAATAAARLAGADLKALAGAVKSFPGVEHRLEFVRSLAGVDYFNDSKATNVDAALKAIQAFPGSLWVILGGKDKDSDFTPLRDALAGKVRAALLIGAAASKIAAQLAGAVELAHCGAIENALDYAWRHAKPGDTVLLAPACASFDQFENFEYRGRWFKQCVNRLAEGSSEEVRS
ncbi:MAG: UDP-N-acetylmuramoyl-L-alanine--D-glutamate ligase [Acidimicrobiia bacterium]|nr:UDP-N-acetylmuramoyl-L-alanine--D-glutamate ligase [Acidimicrobiia bacterium]